MDYKNDNLDELLDFIDPAELSYQDWCGVGMALKDAGHDWMVWDAWSARDSVRYHTGECEKKWQTFNGSEHPVTAGTIVKMALDNGYQPKKQSGGSALGWNDTISDDRYEVTSAEAAQDMPIREPAVWNPAGEIRRYIETLFEPQDYVAFVTEVYENEKGECKPTSGSYHRTAEQLLQELAKYNGDIGAVFGDYNPKCGAWVRFNPVDGQGVKNANVTDYRYALVESDTLPLAQQNGILHELQLPIAALVYTGGKSLHAIVKVNAIDEKEYRKRVEYLFSICDKNGLQVDKANKNPSRLSRLPGVERNGRKQFIVDTNIGFSTWDDWVEWIESVNDDLPDFENMADIWEHMPELAPSLIDGVLRQGHKMLLAGPSKAGKSFLLLELAISIIEGRKWLGWQCARGKVLYVNLELDKASCAHRIQEVYNYLRIPPSNVKDLEIWHLRGVSKPLDKLVPSLVWRAKKNKFIAVIIDPIYKVITGDENSADQMAYFCNQFDKVCTQLGCAVIYCHHHSKGAQGGKRSMDRASGSGVFARDPDALIDMTELDLTEDIVKQMQNREACNICAEYLNRCAPVMAQDTSPDDLLNRSTALKLCCDNLSREQYSALCADLQGSDKRIRQITAWRMEGTLREFPKFEPKNLWFRYPVHEEDEIGVLKDLQTESQMQSYQVGGKRGGAAQKKAAKAKAADKNAELLNTFNAVNVCGDVTVQDLAEYLGVEEKTIRRRIKSCGELKVDKNIVTRQTQ